MERFPGISTGRGSCRSYVRSSLGDVVAGKNFPAAHHSRFAYRAQIEPAPLDATDESIEQDGKETSPRYRLQVGDASLGNSDIRP